jgi:transposase-like protein
MNSLASNAIFLPPFPDGELVNHFLGRICLYSGKASQRTLSMRFLGRRRPLGDGMPNDLQRFHEEIGYIYCSIDVLIDRHTLCDYHCCGLPFQRFAAQRQRLTGRLKGSTRLNHLPVMFASNERAQLRCPECEKEQENALGFAFTHRRTEVPFVSVCAIHGTLLASAVWNTSQYDALCRCVPNEYQRKMAQEYARRVSEAVSTPVEESPYHKDSVVESLRQQGWMAPDGHFRYEDFVLEFSLFFKDAFSDVRLALLVEQREYVEAAVCNLLCRRHNVHPVWCVLVLWFAQNCAFDKRILMKLAPGAAATLSKEVVEQSLRAEGTIRSAARALKVDAASLGLRCKQLGIQRRWCSQVMKPVLVAEVNAAIDDGTPVQEIVERFGISRTTVFRYKASRTQQSGRALPLATMDLEAAKAEWAEELRVNPHLATSTVHRRHPVAWRTLNREAPDWLREHPGRDSEVPTPLRRKLPERLLPALNDAMDEAARSFAGHIVGPRKASNYRLRKLTGVSDYMQGRFRSKRQ